MQIKPQFRSAVHSDQSLSLHAALSAGPLPRRKPSADEQFLEQNAWANPQHPAHQHLQQLAQQQQASRQSHLSSSLITPVTQRRIIDRSSLKGSASTIPDENSVLSSSAAATPLNMEPQNRQPPGKGVIMEPYPLLSHTQPNLSSYSALAVAEDDGSPTETRRRVQNHGVPERAAVSQESPGGSQQATVPVPSSIFSAALNKQNAALRPGLFSEHLGIRASSSPSSAVKSNEVPDNPLSSPPGSHLQHLQSSSSITAGTGLGRFTAR